MRRRAKQPTEIMILGAESGSDFWAGDGKFPLRAAASPVWNPKGREVFYRVGNKMLPWNLAEEGSVQSFLHISPSRREAGAR